MYVPYLFWSTTQDLTNSVRIIAAPKIAPTNVDSSEILEGEDYGLKASIND